MSTQVLWDLIQGHSGQWLNGLAMFFAVAGSWIMIATRIRVQRAGLADGRASQAWLDSEPAQRLNQFFYAFACASLGAALVLSWCSTAL